MGTQQLLLIVLGVIIVGIAVVVGITIFGTNAEQANKDAITQDCLRVAAAAQGYFNKPVMLGGGGGSYDGIDFADCGMTPDATDPLLSSNDNGDYQISTASGTDFEIIGANLQDATKTVTVAMSSTTMVGGGPTYSTNW